jgi:hypothetical protein
MKPIVCLEGASAVGKTTTSKKLATYHNAYVVEEVNKLFGKRTPNDSVKEWYLEKQVQRWSIACNEASNHDFVILDGDVLHALWYRWCFNFSGWNTLDNIRDSYRSKLVAGHIGLPNKYIVLTIGDREELKRRKENDSVNIRKNFELHLDFIDPIMRYFKYMSTLRDNYVTFIEASTIQGNIEKVLQESLTTNNMTNEVELEIFDHMVDWISKNKAF